MGPQALAQVLRPLKGLFPAADHARLLVGLDEYDDAAVYRLHSDEALIATVDFFPPIVDDAYDFGAIAAANAMSDVFAMGGEVLLALNLLGWPEDLDAGLAARVLAGGADTVRAAGAVVAGGHTVVDAEPKYGLAVIGRVHPDRLLRLAGARPGDVLVLTKPLGTGLISTAHKAGQAAARHVAVAVASMTQLNRAAGLAAVAAGARAATDVTGFGLAGHALALAEHSGVALHLRVKDLPLLPGALEYAAAGHAPGGTWRNKAAFGPQVRGDEELGLWELVIYDPQTSGGLLVALPQTAVEGFQESLAAAGVRGHIIGRVEKGEGLVVGSLPPEGQQEGLKAHED